MLSVHGDEALSDWKTFFHHNYFVVHFIKFTEFNDVISFFFPEHIIPQGFNV